jgi:hypothetical protein
MVVLIALIAVIGGYLAFDTLTTKPHNGHYAIGERIPTSFGGLTIESFETLRGLNENDLGGMSHGIQNYVAEDKAQIQIFVTLTNTTGQPIAYSPDQFRLVDGVQLVEATTASVLHGPIRANASIETTLGFVVPRDGAQFAIEFRDLDSATPFVIDLGSTDHAPSGGTDEHH